MKFLNSFLIVFVILFGMTSESCAQYVLPSDTTALPYVVDDLVNAIQECYEQPVQTNEYAHFLSNEVGFPTLSLGSALSTNDLVQLKIWVNSNQGAIEKFLIRRKKNYDTYFNPAVQE
tara:strand:- start:844 stop:1197 length:354 start_codon:yes stop_codon:yes gene_type:complete